MSNERNIPIGGRWHARFFAGGSPLRCIRKVVFFGGITSVLLAGVLIGQTKIVISPNVKSTFFLMFLFASIDSLPIRFAAISQFLRVADPRSGARLCEAQHFQWLQMPTNRIGVV